jgi:hypothetical protein
MRFIIFLFQALRSGRFKRGFDRVNLHCPTVLALAMALPSIAADISEPCTTSSQGLTLVQFSAQPEPFRDTKYTLKIP